MKPVILKNPKPLAPPVLILAGGADSLGTPEAKTRLDALVPVFENALQNFSGTLISGGTPSGVPGLAGAIAARMATAKTKKFRLVGYAPENAEPDPRYDEIRRVGKTFSHEQPAAYWDDIRLAQIPPSSVKLIGYAGGPISAHEYRLALAQTASVALIENSGGAAEKFLENKTQSITSLPAEATAMQNFLF